MSGILGAPIMKSILILRAFAINIVMAGCGRGSSSAVQSEYSVTDSIGAQSIYLLCISCT